MMVIALVICWAIAAAVVLWTNIEELREVDNFAQWLLISLLLAAGAPAILVATII